MTTPRVSPERLAELANEYERSGVVVIGTVDMPVEVPVGPIILDLRDSHAEVERLEARLGKVNGLWPNERGVDVLSDEAARIYEEESGTTFSGACSGALLNERGKRIELEAEVERLTARCKTLAALLREFRDDWARHIKGCESEDCLICARRKDFMRRVLAELEGAAE